MSSTVGNIVSNYSGGAANANPSLSLGGVRSSIPIGSQILSVPIQVTGVSVKFAHNNPQGAGTLKYTLTGNTLSWRPPSSATDYAKPIIASGEYILGDPVEGFIVVDVATASLPAGSRTDTIGVTPAFGALWDSVQPSESLSGSTEYRCTYIRNTGDTILYNVKVWILSQTTGQDSVAIALDPAGKGNGTTTGVAIVIANEKDTGNALAAVTFSTPAGIGEALLVGDLAPNECHALWEKRIVPSNTTQQALQNNYTIGVGADI